MSETTGIQKLIKPLWVSSGKARRSLSSPQNLIKQYNFIKNKLKPKNYNEIFIFTTPPRSTNNNVLLPGSRNNNANFIFDISRKFFLAAHEKLLGARS